MSHDTTWEAFLREWNPIEARIRALDAALWRRATALSQLGAGRNVWHNAMLSLADGHPWREIDYTALRRAVRIDGVERDALRRIEARLRRSVYARHYPDRQRIAIPTFALAS